MLIAVIGGGLQGTEAVYLALQAGYKVVVVDKKRNVPASRMGHVFLHEDVTEREDLYKLLPGVGVVIPALEDDAALEATAAWCKKGNIPFAFGPEAYRISSSKRESDRLFARLGIPAPRYWPEAGFPLVAKPDSSSGSRGVQIIRDKAALEKLFPGIDQESTAVDGWVLQEYLEGPSYSLEVTGMPGNYRAIQVTDLGMDEVYDCNKVTAPTVLEPQLAGRFVEMSLKIAEAVSLKGIMDVEVILHHGELKVLEIDARLPSQTPIAVYHSTGFNMVRALAEMFTQRHRRAAAPTRQEPKHVILEHIKVKGREIEFLGERIMKEGGPLRIEPGFFGADEAITDYSPGKSTWVATLIVSGNDRAGAEAKRDGVIENINKQLLLTERE